MRLYSLAAVLVTLCSNAGAQVYYNINFNSPGQPTNSILNTSLGDQGVSLINFGTPTAVPSYDQLKDQPVRLDMTGNDPLFYYDQFELVLPNPLAPKLNVNFDFDSMDLVGSLGHFVILLDTPTIRNLQFEANGDILLIGESSGGWYTDTIGHFSDRTAYHFNIAVDQAAGIWSIYQDGALLGSDAWIAPEGIQDIRFSYGLLSAGSGPDGGSVGLDNLVVSSPTSFTAVPESSTFAEFGAMALCAGVLGRGIVRRKTLGGEFV